LRQMSAIAARIALFAPQPALRVRWNTSTDMPWPKEEPVGENPPEGASINFYLGAPSDIVKLEIVDSRNRVVRTYASTDSLPYVVPAPGNAPVPLYWYRAPRVLPASAGVHRWYWDVHYQNVPGVGGGFGGGGAGLSINAIPRNTAPAPRAPWVAPGNYTVRLTVGTQVREQPIEVKQDPRVRTPAPAMREVYALTDSMYFTLHRLRDAIAALPAVPADTARPGPETLRGSFAALGALLNSLQSADVPATATQRSAIGAALRNANTALSAARRRAGQ